MSFWKQEPPKPTEAFKNLEPMRESCPIAIGYFIDVSTRLPHNALEIALIRTDALGGTCSSHRSLESSDDQRLVVRIRERETHLA